MYIPQELLYLIEIFEHQFLINLNGCPYIKIVVL